MKMPPVHPAANLFPMLGEVELQDLAADIKANGLHHPITMYGAQLLDGRNRWRACQIAGVEPRLRDWSGDSPTAYVLSINAKRRHLTPSQLAAVAVEALPLFEAEAKKRQGRRSDISQKFDRSSGRASEKAAAAVNTNRQYVSDVKTIAKTAPHLVERIKSGEVSVPDAKAIASLDREEQGAVLQKLDAGEAKTAKQALRQLNREGRIEQISQASAPLAMSRRYPIILADPPWRYDDAASRGAAEDHYPTMSVDDIAAMPVEKHSTNDAVLLLWATSALLPEALHVMEAWGFAYKSSAVWVKPRIGLGHWFRVRHEFLLVGVRGAMVPPCENARPDSIISAPLGEHSRKPDVVHELIEKMWPELPKLELFARRERRGWDVWGNQVKGAA